ncbi:HAMP domain-containing histidine kinase [Candidatus Kaiserbacteria bacterium]|nr:HAMP domain-containing histidine kinase [Candidatus Kaiserbacteria bacterium]
MSNILDLEKKIAELESIIEDMDKSAMLLVRRDLDLKRANEKLSSLDKNKSEFVAIAAHQMRTPLSAIRWSQQMILNDEFGPLNQDQKNIVKQTLQSVDSLVTLVTNLLIVDQLEVGKNEVIISKIDVVVVINQVIANLYQLATEKRIRLVFNETNDQAFVDSNVDKMKDVITNLLDNAIKYTPVDGNITLSVTKEAYDIEISISDTGIGIPKEYASNLFSRFSRAENAKKVDPNGSGLGLYIVKKIIESNNGTIRFENNDAGGSTFIIKLPKSEK